MAKVNVNTAGREELVEVAGLRPELADAVLRFRGEHGGAIASADALGELPGVGPATLEQLRTSLTFGERGRNGDDTRVVQRATEGMAEVGRALMDLLHEQTRHNLETLTALIGTVDWNRAAEAVDWDQVFQIQGEFLRASVERSARLTQRCLEATQVMMAAAATAPGQDEIRRAA